MEGHKKRMADEYQELGTRMVKLQNILTKHANGELGFELACPVELLKEQLSVMRKYMGILEQRAKIEGVALSLVVEG